MNKVLENYLIAVKDAAEKALIALANGEAESMVDEVEAPKKTRKTKAKKEVEENDDADLDMGFSVDDDGDDAPATITVDDVREAFKKYVKKQPDAATGRKNAGKILTKFKAKSVDEIDADDYEAVLEILNKK